MNNQSMESYLTGRDPESTPPKPREGKKLIPEGAQTVLIIVLLISVAYLLFDSYRFRAGTAAELSRIHDQLLALENRDKAGEAQMAALSGEIDTTQREVGDTRSEMKRTTSQIQQDSEKTKAQLTQAISTKADSTLVAAVRNESEARIGQVSSEVGGVKNEVVNVRTDLASTRRDLEGTQRQLIDVQETLSAAVAKNASELEVLRRRGERDYFEFEIPKKNFLTRVEDIRLVLTKTDHKKGKFNLQIVVDDSRLEKKDRTVNEPIQFLVGRNRVRYEIVVNWVQKDRIGGYLSIPKDKTLAAERRASN